MSDQLLMAALDLSKTVIPATVVAATIMLALRAYLQQNAAKMDRSRYDDIRHEAVLSEMRASFERQIASLSRELVATPARWSDVNHLVVSGQQHQPESAGKGAINPRAFLNSFGINPDTVKTDDRSIFVLTPFSDQERSVFEVVRGVCSRSGFIVSRGDERRAEGDILQQVIDGIIRARVIIANISSRNPNVLFELGIAMALGKPTLLLSDTLSKAPFDISGRRIIVFSTRAELETRLAEELLKVFNKADSEA